MVPIVNKNRLNSLVSKLVPWRLWVQSVFLLVWLDPFGMRLHNICSPVFHCYACPLASFACPTGVIAQFGAIHVFPFVAIGFLLVIGALLGSLICGWAGWSGGCESCGVRGERERIYLPTWAKKGGSSWIRTAENAQWRAWKAVRMWAIKECLYINFLRKNEEFLRKIEKSCVLFEKNLEKLGTF